MKKKMAPRVFKRRPNNNGNQQIKEIAKQPLPECCQQKPVERVSVCPGVNVIAASALLQRLSPWWSLLHSLLDPAGHFLSPVAENESMILRWRFPVAGIFG